MLIRYIRASRISEVLLMQGFIVMGVVLGSEGKPLTHWLYPVGPYLFSTVLLIASIYAFNGWGEYGYDVQDREGRHYLDSSSPISRKELFIVSLLNLSASLILLGGLSLYVFPGGAVFLFALLFWCLWGFYSHPSIHAKARAGFSSLIHLTGGAMMFLLGIVPFHSLSTSHIVPALYFAILFEAGHLNHEMKDYDADLRNGLRTNAVVFGKERIFTASFLLFLLSYPLLFIMIYQKVVGLHAIPLSILLLIFLAFSFVKTLRMGIRREDSLQYRRTYRILFFTLWLPCFLF